MNNNTLIISIICLLVGFSAAYFLVDSAPDTGITVTSDLPVRIKSAENALTISNPFSSSTSSDRQTIEDARLSTMENDISALKQQIQKLLHEIEKIKSGNETDSAAVSASARRTTTTPANNRRIFSYENLVNAGIEPGMAEDIARRKSALELKRLELQDRATRDGYIDSQRYYDELADINNQEISLRDELGDNLFDEYLFKNKQNNRIRVVDVITGSAAEQAGIRKNDIILSYDNKRMFAWDELKSMTSEGERGEYVAVGIYRNGEFYNYSVPRGPLGIQMGAIRMKP